jgi:hypothetical protein
MSPSPEISAAAASDSYSNRPLSDVDNQKRPVHFDGHEYTVFGYKDDPSTGFHATAYRSKDTGEVIIAYRGTDPDYKHHTLTTLQDALVDVTMVKDKINPQKNAADAFTQEVLKKAAELGISKDHVTTAGHSLGGTLAEIEAAQNGLHGTTLNAYGAADLGYGIRPGGNQVTNYVMAGDVVSAASRHFGEVKVLASQADIDRLHTGRYLGAAPGTPPPNPLMTMSLGDHSGTHFTGEGGMENVLAPANLAQYEARYAQNKAAFDHFRGDVQQDRVELATAMNHAGSHNIETTLANMPPHLQRQLAEYNASLVDTPIQHLVEHNRVVHGIEGGLQQGADGIRAGGHNVHQGAEQLAQGVRQAGQTVQRQADEVSRGAQAFLVVDPLPALGVVVGAKVTGYVARAEAEGIAQASHLTGKAADAVGEFGAGQWQSAKHAVEQGAHLAGQVDTKAAHVVEAGAVMGIDAVSDTYQSTKANLQALGENAAHAYGAASQGLHHAEKTAERAYDTATHPARWFHHDAPAVQAPAIVHGPATSAPHATTAGREPSPVFLELSARLDRLDKAMDTGDWSAVHKDIEAFNNTPAGRAINAQAKATVEREQQHAVPPPPRDPCDPGHPDHDLNQSIRTQLRGLHADAGIYPSSALIDPLTAAVALSARENRMTHVDNLQFSADKSNIMATQGQGFMAPHSFTAVQPALQTPPEQSYQQMAHVTQQQVQMDQQRQQQVAQTQQQGPSMGR